MEEEVQVNTCIIKTIQSGSQEVEGDDLPCHATSGETLVQVRCEDGSHTQSAVSSLFVEFRLIVVLEDFVFFLSGGL